MLFPWLWLRSTGFPFRWVDEQALPDPDDPAAFDREVLAARARLVARMSKPAVVEALVLSNPDAADRVAALAGADLARVTSRTRQRLRLAWSYLQRFCAKNETCGSFGPLAWGVVDPGAAEDFATRPADPAAGALRRRSARVEHWALRGLADALVASGRATPPYRLHPACDLDGDDLRVPVGRRVTLTAPAARYVRAVQASALEPPGSHLRPLIAAGALRREIPVPPGSGPGAIEAALGHPLDVVARLESLRARFERTTGATARRALLDEARAELGAAGVDTTRATGVPYAARQPFYEDCERNTRFRVGGGTARVLRDDLPPLLRLHRLVAECAASRLHEHYASVDVEDFPSYLRAVRAPAVVGPVLARVADELRTALHAAWDRFGPAEEISLDDGDLTAVADALRARFPDHHRHAGVLGVGVVSPDVLLVGDGTVVLGEVHPCVPAALQPVALPFLDQAEAEDALALAERVLCGGRTVLAAADAGYQRSLFAWPVTASLAEVVLPGSTSRCPPERTVPAGRGRVRVVDGLVRFVDRATGRTEDMVTVLSSDLHRVVFDVAGAVLGGALTARLRYRRVVVRRRRWLPDPAGLPAAPHPAEDFADFRALRAWAGAHGLPRRCFVRADTEPKPIYLDWGAPLAVDAFAKVARGAAALVVTEFSPGPWFTDDLGAHTAELRMTHVV